MPVQAPDLAPPVPVALDPKTTVLLVLDISDTSAKQPATLECVPAVKRLIDNARAAGAKIVFALGRAAALLVEVVRLARHAAHEGATAHGLAPKLMRSERDSVTALGCSGTFWALTNPGWLSS